MIDRLRKLPLAHQITLIAALLCLLLVGSLIAFVTVFADRMAMHETEQQLRTFTQGVVDMLELSFQQNRSRALTELAAARSQLPGRLQVGAATIATGGTELPVVRAGNSVLNGDAALLERIKAQTGIEPALMVRRGDQFFRAATLLRNAAGKSMLGTPVAPGKDTETLLAGGTYAGVVERAGKYFISALEPIKDDSGRVVGALSARVSIDAAMALMRQAVSDMKVGQTGYVYVIAPAAASDDSRFVFHPKLAGRKVGEIGDAALSDLVRGQIAAGHGIFRYRWPDAAGQPRPKIVATARSPSWGWLVSAGSFEDEFTIETRQLRNDLIVMSAGLGVLAMLAMVWALKRQLRPLQAVLTAMERLGRGDLSRRLPAAADSRSEVDLLAGRINRTQDEMGALIGRITASSQALDASARELGGVSSEVVRASSKQSESASSLAAAVEELSVSVATVAEHARHADEQTQAAHACAEDGRRSVDDMVAEMRRIAGEIETSSALVTQLGEHMQEISGVVAVIRGVADQTNMLALNAAIEAARAGEAGRGFAVVADEVRKLAERTAQSTQEIGRTIATVQQESDQAVGAIRHMSSEIATGVALASQAGEALRRLSEQSAATAATVSEIAAATSQQSVASQSVAQGVETIAQMAERNSGATRQSEAETARLAALAGELRQSVGSFQV